MAFFNYPGTIDANTPAVAAEVQTNFDELLAWVLDNLIQKDGSLAMTGPLVLAPGPPGAPDHAANKAYVDAVMPVGVMMEYAGTSLPAGWLWCNGGTYTNTSQPKLAGAIGRSYTDAGVTAGSFQVPDMRKRMPVGYDATEVAVYGLGVKNAMTARNSELLYHAHTVPRHMHSGRTTFARSDHTHGVNINTSYNGAHGHLASGGGTNVFVNTTPGGLGGMTPGIGNMQLSVYTDTGDHIHNVLGNTGTMSSNHDHNFDTDWQEAFNTEANGAGSTLIDKNLPPYLVVNYIIYAGA